MESYQRDFSWHLPVAEGNKQPDPSIDFAGTIKQIKFELLEALNDEEKIQMQGLFRKVDMAGFIVALGSENDYLYRGAIELRRALPAIAAFRFELNTIVLLDELSQLYMKAGMIEDEVDEHEFSEKDDAMFEALGGFGFEADRYNEQALSYDYFSIIQPTTPMGSYTALEVSDWLVS